MYVNGEQRLCNDFPTVALTMAEGALGFGQVLYHSAAEREEFRAPYWDRTGQRYYLEIHPSSTRGPGTTSDMGSTSPHRPTSPRRPATSTRPEVPRRMGERP
jgi:hypothetical protein